MIHEYRKHEFYLLNLILLIIFLDHLVFGEGRIHACHQYLKIVIEIVFIYLVYISPEHSTSKLHNKQVYILALHRLLHDIRCKTYILTGGRYEC